jgi:hypothetical protein
VSDSHISANEIFEKTVKGDISSSATKYSILKEECKFN